jgi:hypothetical protein
MSSSDSMRFPAQADRRRFAAPEEGAFRYRSASHAPLHGASSPRAAAGPARRRDPRGGGGLLCGGGGLLCGAVVPARRYRRQPELSRRPAVVHYFPISWCMSPMRHMFLTEDPCSAEEKGSKMTLFFPSSTDLPREIGRRDIQGMVDRYPRQAESAGARPADIAGGGRQTLRGRPADIVGCGRTGSQTNLRHSCRAGSMPALADSGTAKALSSRILGE